MALRLLAATTSQGKLRDFRTAAHAYSVFIDPLPAADTIPAPDEDGDTFTANATLKAVYYSRFAPANWCWQTIPDWKWMHLAERRGYAQLALRQIPAWWTRPMQTTTRMCGTT